VSFLYGDSTKFPHDIDYIELTRNAVDCAVQLLSAQHAIAAALAREETQNQTRNVERARLLAMSEAMENAFAPFLSRESEHTAQAAARALKVAKTSLEEARADEERRATEAAAHAQQVLQRAGESAHRALEAFLVRYDLPETELGLTLSCAGEQGYAGEIAIRCPFGVRATFALRIGADHAWSRPRRVGDLVPSMEVRVPQPSGWISRRVEMATTKLDRMFVTGVRGAGADFELSLRKAAGTGPGYRITVDLRGERGVLLTPLDETGLSDSEAPLHLEGEEGQRMLELSHRIIASVQGLNSLRGSMSSVALEDRPLPPLEWPELVAQRLLAQLAPIVTEIARRSGAPGELVLRRDVGDGRREELYVTKADLLDRLLVLPPERRAPFAALGLVPAIPALPMETQAPGNPASLQPLPPHEGPPRPSGIGTRPTH
jgi:hypothetical protein